ncbi:MAG: LamG-like jellyroll fold domain-containing protein [Candidatus Paceibacterota bacterium]
MQKIKIKAFTLIELLVVIAIIGILSALIVVGMSSTTQKATIAKAQVFSNSLRNSLMDNLVSEWKLDGNTNDTWAALFANNGIWSGPTAPNTVATYGTTSECVSGQCMDFDGVDDIIDCGNNISLSMGTKDHTVSIWAKFDSAIATGDGNALFRTSGTQLATYGGYLIWRYPSTSRLRIWFSDGTSNIDNFLSATGTLVANTWYNIVVTFDRDSVIRAYINGQVQPETLNIVALLGNIQNQSPLTIGAYASTYGRHDGKLDEARLFHAITTLSQIHEQYYAGLNRLLANRGVEIAEYQQRIAELKSNYAKD